MIASPCIRSLLTPSYLSACGRRRLLTGLAPFLAGVVQAAVIVAPDGSGDYATVQAAIDAAPVRAAAGTGPATSWWEIQVRPGRYHERVQVPADKGPIRLFGEATGETVITFNLDAKVPGEDGRPIGTGRTASVVVAADDFRAEHITFENSFGPGSQALAIRVDGDRTVFRHCRFTGWQDTVYLTRGRQYFEACLIEGAVDYIFGGGTAFFERCHLRCLGNGYITAASTPAEEAFGFVFANCRVSGPEGVLSYLGRPWRDHAAVAWLNTNLGAVVRPEAWHNWSKPHREATARFAEFNSRGPGAATAARVGWAQTVTKAETLAWNAPQVLAGADGWNPLLIDCPPARFERDVVYAEADGQRLLLDVAVPPGEGPFPVALIVHGGGWTGGDKTRDITPLFAPLTAGGYVWVSINYRLAPEARWPEPAEDVRAAIRWVQQHIGGYGGDPTRVAIFGHSAGGQLAFMAALAEQAAGGGVQALVGLAPVTDFVADSVVRGGPSTSLQAFLGVAGELSAEALPGLRAASPLYELRVAPAPVLMVHGDGDKTVPLAQSEAFLSRVRAFGGQGELQVLAGAPHGVVDWSKHDAAWTGALIAWLRAQGI